ncbi:MAG: (p)ppGpp synthetase [Treponema sp.]
MDVFKPLFLTKTDLAQSYSEYKPHFDLLLTRLLDYLHSILSLGNSLTYKARVKSFESYYKKIQKFKIKSVGKEMPLLTDILGIRIMCTFISNLEEVKNILLQNFELYDVENKGDHSNYKSFGYESIHFVVNVPDSFKVGLSIPEGIVFEIQLRTVLQDAWAEIEHDLVYKSETTALDVPMKRKLAAINASLTLADIVFQEINDYQKNLKIELDIRRFDFYKKADEYTANLLKDEASDCIGSEQKVNETNINAIETIDDMLVAALKAHNNTNYSLAIEIYTRVIAEIEKKNQKDLNNLHAQGSVLSVIYKHRGMAYFFAGDYQEACNDFKNSEEFDPKNFRAYYYMGIVLVLLGKNYEAIEEFTKSLDIMPNQAHVYFRRALSYYNLKRYVEALQDLNIASELGLNTVDMGKLRSAIAKKIDIV